MQKKIDIKIQLNGLQIGMFVSKIDKENNQVIITERKGLDTKIVKVKNLNWLNDEITDQKKCSAKIRYNSPAQSCIAKRIDDDSLELIFDENVFAVTPGQSAVLYDGDYVIGGGIIY